MREKEEAESRGMILKSGGVFNKEAVPAMLTASAYGRWRLAEKWCNSKGFEPHRVVTPPFSTKISPSRCLMIGQHAILTFVF